MYLYQYAWFTIITNDLATLFTKTQLLSHSDDLLIQPYEKQHLQQQQQEQNSNSKTNTEGNEMVHMHGSMNYIQLHKWFQQKGLRRGKGCAGHPTGDPLHQLNRITHKLAAHRRGAHNPAARWCAGSVVCNLHPDSNVSWPNVGPT